MDDTKKDPVYKERRAHWAHVIEHEVKGPLIRGRLRAGDRFCAIGVACDIYDPARWQLISTKDKGIWMYSGLSVLEPKCIDEWFGVSFHAMGDISIMNDRGESPKKIADYIRSL